MLEYLFAIGRLPLRRAGVAALEIGAGPAPALSAIREFYDDLARAEPISWATAYRFAYEQGTDHPSAYDLIFVPNFLTRADAPQTFQAELRGLMRSLTPGGVLVVLSGTYCPVSLNLVRGQLSELRRPDSVRQR